MSKKSESLCERRSISAQHKGEKTVKYEEIKRGLFVWFRQERSQNTHINGTILKEKVVKEIALKPNIKFEPSNQWLDLKLFRHHI
jgi:hypothetical protein